MPSWILAVLLAPFIGSFLSVVVVRHDAPAQMLFGRSACGACGKRLGAADLAPILSWLFLRGKCRSCGTAIGLFYPAIEIAALAVALWSAMVFSGLALWASCVLGWVLLALAVTDLKYFRLPDFLTWPLVLAGLLATALLDSESAIQSVVGHAMGAAIGYVFVRLLRFAYRAARGREGMGLGDAKLLAAAGAWVSWQGLPSVLVIASLSALAVVLLWRGPKIDPAQRIPFGVFLSLGLWITWLYGPLTVG